MLQLIVYRIRVTDAKLQFYMMGLVVCKLVSRNVEVKNSQQEESMNYI
jgi:hypothetical protein